MAVIYSNTVLNAQADAAESAIGTAPTLEIRAGTPPAAIGTADSGTLLATMTLPSDWLGAASAGVKTLLGTLSATAAAGIRGAFFYSTIMAIAGAFMGLAGNDDDDPDEIVRKWVIEHVPDAMIGHAVSGMILDGVPGYLTGTSLTNRVGMQDMWFHTTDRDLNATQQWMEWTTQLLGAGAGIGFQLWKGKEEIEKGNIERGVEKMLPAALRNVAKAIRYLNEGVQDKYGNPIVDNVPLRDALKQAIGFTPAEIADRFARNTYQNNRQDRIEAKATEARKAVARAMLAGDAAAEAEGRKAVDKFNAKYPEYQIRPKSIMQSMRNMENRKDRMEFGVDLNKKLADRIKEGTAPSIYQGRW